MMVVIIVLPRVSESMFREAFFCVQKLWRAHRRDGGQQRGMSSERRIFLSGSIFIHKQGYSPFEYNYILKISNVLYGVIYQLPI